MHTPKKHLSNCHRILVCGLAWNQKWCRFCAREHLKRYDEHLWKGHLRPTQRSNAMRMCKFAIVNNRIVGWLCLKSKIKKFPGYLSSISSLYNLCHILNLFSVYTFTIFFTPWEKRNESCLLRSFYCNRGRKKVLGFLWSRRERTKAREISRVRSRLTAVLLRPDPK